MTAARRKTAGPAGLAATLAIVALLGCDSELDLTNGSLPQPALSATASADTCSTPTGGVTVELDPTDVTIVFGEPSVAPEDRVHVEGAVQGLADGQVVVLVLTPISSSCPIWAAGEAAVDDVSGTYVADAEVGDLGAFRVTAVAFTGSASDLSCDSVGDCLAIDAGGVLAASEGVRVELR